jgi:hypothetical protein
MKTVKIIKCSDSNSYYYSWYKDKIGNIYDVDQNQNISNIDGGYDYWIPYSLCFKFF